MKAMVNLIVFAMLVAGLTGCAANSAKAPAKVLCPACGYEFQPPLSGL